MRLFFTLLILSVVFNFDIVSTQYSETCKTPENLEGRCIPIDDCPPLLQQLKDVTKNPEAKTILRKMQCGFMGEKPMVCCTTYILKTDIRRSKEDIDAGKKLIPSRKTCGRQVEDKILNGEETYLDEFPWMALLNYRMPNNSMEFNCGGSLISDRYVLTAAHCASPAFISKVGKLESVRLGEHNLTSEKDCITADAGEITITDCSDDPLNIEVEKIIVHPDYDPNSNDRENDIALLRLKETVTYSQSVSPICLPLPEELAKPGELLFVSGWGKTTKALFSPVKLKLQVPIKDIDQCINQFLRARVSLTKKQICAGGEKGKDSCQGDSGGPLMHLIKNTSRWYIEGIVSFGTECGTANWPAVYTRVNQYLDWIYSNIEP